MQDASETHGVAGVSHKLTHVARAIGGRALAVEQREGITWERVQQIAELVLHGPQEECEPNQLPTSPSSLSPHALPSPSLGNRPPTFLLVATLFQPFVKFAMTSSSPQKK